MKPLTIPLFSACATALAIATVIPLADRKTNTPAITGAEAYGQTLQIPNGLPETFSITVPYSGESYVLELRKNSVIGKNTRFLVDNGSETLQQIEGISDCSYTGGILGHSTYSATALLTEDGLIASIIRPGLETIQIEPTSDRSRHAIFTEDVDAPHQKIVDHLENADTPDFEGFASDDTGEMIAASTGPITVGTLINTQGTKKKRSSATLPPERKMDVLEYEIGVEIGSRAFESSTAYNKNIKKAQAAAQSIASNLDARFLHAAGIKHRLGTVIIRTNPSTDPLRSRVVSTGLAKNADVSLAAFKKYWNSNPNIVGNTHDIAVYHVKSPPSGLAYVDSVGSENRYATAGGKGATSWANATLAHEVGHSWSLPHSSEKKLSYEFKPRNPKGSHKVGGFTRYISIMHNSSNRNIGRLATEEAQAVYDARQRKRKYGDLVPNPKRIKPFGYRDIARTKPGRAITIDVIKNDYDANNDVLDVELLDTVSARGGKISIAKTPGPGGRRQLTYTPPKQFSGKDFFHYTVSDSTGLKDWGAVYVEGPNQDLANTKKEIYNYDLGPVGSRVMKGWTALTPKSKGKVSWNRAVQARDRGVKGSLNAINRDLIGSTGKATLSHKVSNGIWALIINLGDSSYAHDKMTVKAEGQVIASQINSAVGEFPYIEIDVEVTDGELNLEFSDEGGQDRMWTATRISLEKVMSY